MERKTKGENLTRQYPVESVGSFFFSCCLGRNHTLSPCYFDIKKKYSKCKCAARTFI